MSSTSWYVFSCSHIRCGGSSTWHRARHQSMMVVMTPKGDQVIAVSVVVAAAKSELETGDTDMEVLYVGQGIGRTGSRTALDRCWRTTSFSRFLLKTLRISPNARYCYCSIVSSMAGRSSVMVATSMLRLKLLMRKIRLISIASATFG